MKNHKCALSQAIRFLISFVMPYTFLLVRHRYKSNSSSIFIEDLHNYLSKYSVLETPARIDLHMVFIEDSQVLVNKAARKIGRAHV